MSQIEMIARGKYWPGQLDKIQRRWQVLPFKLLPKPMLYNDTNEQLSSAYLEIGLALRNGS